MTLYHHLSHAIRIMGEEADYRNWGPLIDALTPEQQAEVRPWLRERVRLILSGARARASKASPPPSSPGSSTRPGTRSRPRKAAQT